MNHKNAIKLETARLILREMNQEGFQSLCAILQDEQTMVAYNGAFNDIESNDVFNIKEIVKIVDFEMPRQPKPTFYKEVSSLPNW